ncbi:MAG: ankyrin repeat domain-containing protein [Pseudomonadota bacterium]
MARSLPRSPNFEHLKKQAKARAREAGLKLSEAQFDLAREYGFASWPKLKHEVLARQAFTTDDFLRAATGRRLDQAKAMLRQKPKLSTVTLQTAAVLGDVGEIERRLEHDPTSVGRSDGPLNWPPLMYLCWSVFLKGDQTGDFQGAARLLLSKGADPNVYCPERSNLPNTRWSALYGAAGEAGQAGVTRLLLAAGADPDDNESLYHAAEQADTACLRLLLEAGATIKSTNAFFRKLDYDDPDGVGLFLDHGADPNDPIWRAEGPQPGTNALFHAIRRGRSAEIVTLLLDRGVDLEARDQDGLTAYAQARRSGADTVAEAIADRGATTSLSPVDRLIAACAAGDADTVRRLLAQDPAVADSLSPTEKRILVDAAFRGEATTVSLLLDAGFDIETRGDGDGTALHHAGNQGQAETVALLIDRGADIEAISTMTDSTPLGWTLYGARYEPNPGGDFDAVVRLLLDAGARIEPYMHEMATDALWDLLQARE